MGHNITKEGKFKSDKYPDLPEDKIILSFNDPIAIRALHKYSMETPDRELGEDIRERCLSKVEEKRSAGLWYNVTLNIY